MNFHTLLIDGDILLHRAISVATASVTFDDVSHWEVDQRRAGSYLREELGDLKDRFSAKRVLIALGDRTANFRKDLCPTYKAHRTQPKPPGFKELEGRLRAHAKVLSLPRLEGDDVLGLMLTKLPDAVCVSIDKDLLQVPGWHYNPDTDQLAETTPARAEHRHLFQTLTGDRVDGYPGCPGCGPVKAAKVLTGPEPSRWDSVVRAFEKAGLTEADALLQARLAFILRQGYYDTKTGEIKLWVPTS